MHGAGNDFLLFDGREDPELAANLPELVARLCHRRYGLGADGVLLLLPIERHDEARVIYFNSNGSRASFCGNGSRCAARFVAERWGLTRVDLITDFAVVPAEVVGSLVTLTLPAPTAIGEWRTWNSSGDSLRGRLLVIGVPHLVVPVDWDDFESHPLAALGPALRGHPELPPGGANVHFVSVDGADLRIRSWERGVEGETLACGSGAVATGLIALAEGWVVSPARVHTASGRVLDVMPIGVPPGCGARLTGPAEWIAAGDVAPELLDGLTTPTRNRRHLT